MPIGSREDDAHHARVTVKDCGVGDHDRLLGMITDRDIAVRAVAEARVRRRTCATS